MVYKSGKPPPGSCWKEPQGKASGVLIMYDWAVKGRTGHPERASHDNDKKC